MAVSRDSATVQGVTSIMVFLILASEISVKHHLLHFCQFVVVVVVVVIVFCAKPSWSLDLIYQFARLTEV